MRVQRNGCQRDEYHVVDALWAIRTSDDRGVIHQYAGSDHHYVIRGIGSGGRSVGTSEGGMIHGHE